MSELSPVQATRLQQSSVACAGQKLTRATGPECLLLLLTSLLIHRFHGEMDLPGQLKNRMSEIGSLLFFCYAHGAGCVSELSPVSARSKVLRYSGSVSLVADSGLSRLILLAHGVDSVVFALCFHAQCLPHINLNCVHPSLICNEVKTFQLCKQYRFQPAAVYKKFVTITEHRHVCRWRSLLNNFRCL